MIKKSKRVIKGFYIQFLNYFIIIHSKALSLLKKKKMMENVLDKTDGQLANLEKMVIDIEFAQIQQKVLDGLQSGNLALKQLHSLMSIDKIESILDETREGIDKQKVKL